MSAIFLAARAPKGRGAAASGNSVEPIQARMGKRELKLVDPRQPSNAKIRRMGEIVRERMRLEAEAREAEEAARIEAEAAAEAAALALANGNGCKKEDEEAEEVEVKEEEKEEEKEAEEEIDDAKLEAMREELEDLQQQKHQLFVKLKRVLKEEEKEKQEKKAAEEAKAAEAERQEQRRLAEEKRCPWRPTPVSPSSPSYGCNFRRRDEQALVCKIKVIISRKMGKRKPRLGSFKTTTSNGKERQILDKLALLSSRLPQGR